jgi:uncharacterized SAM-dependent methyltransferase
VPERFVHLAFFDPERSRVEMHLRSLGLQGAHVAGRRFAFEDGETIHTENSYRYSRCAFGELAERGGLQLVRSWFDQRGWFALHWLRAATARETSRPRPFAFG